MKRLCPKCGKRTDAVRCPSDSTATLVLGGNPESKLAEGTEINGRYRIGTLIGQGGFGAVYKATALATDQDVAIKLLAVPLDSGDSDTILRFFAEAQVTASLKHPNTIRVFDFGQTEGGALYIAMELLRGQTLNDLLKHRLETQEVLTEAMTLDLGIQTLRSLAEAHLANLVHRDLKPHNIYLHEVEGDDPVVKVLDFGIAKRLGSNLTGTGKAFGTPSYMSPEQAQNKELDRRSDLYSLAVVLYQCVAGQPPFDGDNPLAVLLSHVRDPVPDLRKVARTPVSEGFVAVLERALAKDPQERFKSAIEMRQAMEAVRAQNWTEPMRMPPAVAAAPMRSAADAVGTAGYDVAADLHTAAYAPSLHGDYSATSPAGHDAAAAVVLHHTLQANRLPLATPSAPPVVGEFTAWVDKQEFADALEPTREDVPQIQPPIRNRPAGWTALAVAFTLLAVGGLATFWAVSTRSSRPATPPPPVEIAAETAVQPAVPKTELAPIPAVAEPVAPTPAAAVIAPVILQVRIETTPAGASLTIGNREVGLSPVLVDVPADGRVSGVAKLAGYEDVALDLGRDSAPLVQVELKKVDPKANALAKKPPRRPLRPNGSSPEPDRPKQKSALEERL